MALMVIVDWEDLLSSLQRKGFMPSIPEFPNVLRHAVEEYAAHLATTLCEPRVYSTPQSISDTQSQMAWYAVMFDIRANPTTADEIKHQITLDIMDHFHNHPGDVVVLVCGPSQYSSLAKRLQAQFVRWSAGDPVFFKKIPVTPISESSGHTLESIANHGVAKLLRAEVCRRACKQLLRTQRRYSTTATVGTAFDRLVNVLQNAGWVPDLIISWTDQTKHWTGSEAVAARLASSLGKPIVTIGIRELGEIREIVQLPDFPIIEGKALVVDDAAFSGRTLAALKNAVTSRYPKIEVKSGVLSAQVPVQWPADFYADTHEERDVLFPWAWSRSIDTFYDLLRQLGTRDRRWMTRRCEGSIQITSLTEQEQSSVSLITASSIGQEYALKRTVHDDELIYVVSGTASIEIEGQEGKFDSEEYLFLPKVVPYTIRLADDTTVIVVVSFPNSSAHRFT